MSEQVAAHLRGELQRGKWTNLMPGRDKLARELGVNRKTVEAALVKLEREGVLEAQGPGKRRLIRLPKGMKAEKLLTVGLLLHDSSNRGQGYIIDLQHELDRRGIGVVVAPKTLEELNMNPKRLGRMVNRISADAWIVVAGSFEVLEWFVGQRKQVFALFGRRRELMISGVGPDKPPAYAEATKALVELGHRRIVLLCAPERRLPKPGASERAFLAEMAAHGIPLSRFQLPDWDGSVAGLHRRLASLFRVTPPTAMILDGIQHLAAAQSFLVNRGFRVPDDVSLICTDEEPWFDWCRPEMAHIRWESKPLVSRVVRWAGNVRAGRKDIRQSEVPAEFVPGGSIGPVNRKQRQGHKVWEA